MEKTKKLNYWKLFRNGQFKENQTSFSGEDDADRSCNNNIQDKNRYVKFLAALDTVRTWRLILFQLTNILFIIIVHVHDFYEPQCYNLDYCTNCFDGDNGIARRTV